MKENKSKDLLYQFGNLFKRGKRKPERNLESLKELASKDPTNAFPHLKIAAIYHQLGQQKNALAEYLKAAELFCDLKYYQKGAAIYSKILKQDRKSEFVRTRLADTYKKMGFLAQAFTQYNELYWEYKCAGEEEKALEIIGFMAELDPKEFTLDEKAPLELQGVEKTKDQEGSDKKQICPDQLPDKSKSFFDLNAMLGTDNSVELGEAKSVTMEETFRGENIFAELEETTDVEKLFLNYNYQMGLACKKMGLIDEAIRQFQKAIKFGQETNEATELLKLCLRDKEHLEDCKAFQGC